MEATTCVSARLSDSTKWLKDFFSNYKIRQTEINLKFEASNLYFVDDLLFCNKAGNSNILCRLTSMSTLSDFLFYCSAIKTQPCNTQYEER